VEFFIAPNPGEEALPLARTASGGELSRIMLAIKLRLADRDRVAAYLFDEVDAGIGGTTADTLGLALAELSDHRQVICITHQPGIAAFAEHHLRVFKKQQGDRTVVGVAALGDQDRVEEIAGLIGGPRVSQKTRAAAAELIQRAAGRRSGGKAGG
jgi:DNA repair protein RecN (Recombination protein N)